MVYNPSDVSVVIYTPIKIKILTGDYKYIKVIMEEFTRYVESFQFMPAYKTGRWNGKACMVDKYSNSMPYGLLFDFIKIHKKKFPKVKLHIDDEVKNLFIGPKVEPKYNLSLIPYGYQDDCIKACLKHTKGIIRSATASGKSLIISYIIKTLHENKEKTGVDKSLIIVSGTQLMEQFIDNFKEYGMTQYSIGRVYKDAKDWDKDIVVSTWQSLSKNKVKLKEFGCVVVDECHGVKAFTLKNIMRNAVNSRYRLGFTGTMHSSELDNWNVKSFTGPILREYSSGFLADEGYISPCNVKMINLEYNRDNWEGTYNDIKDELFTNPYRVDFIKKLAKKLDHNVLILVGKVEKEGEYLEEELKSIKGKECVFLSGKDDVNVREKWRKKMVSNEGKVVFLTFGKNKIEVNVDELIPLNNGENKKASDITINDDIYDGWINDNLQSNE